MLVIVLIISSKIFDNAFWRLSILWDSIKSCEDTIYIITIKTDFEMSAFLFS